MAKNLIIVILIVAALIAGYEVGKNKKKTMTGLDDGSGVVGGGGGGAGMALSESLSLNSDGSCAQKNSSGTILAYIDVSKGNSDTVSWTMVGGTSSTQPRVNFPTNLPFGASTYGGGGSTGGATSGAAAGNIYSFSSLQVWNPAANPPAYATCTNSQSMGVHITQ